MTGTREEVPVSSSRDDGALGGPSERVENDARICTIRPRRRKVSEKLWRPMRPGMFPLQIRVPACQWEVYH